MKNQEHFNGKQVPKFSKIKSKKPIILILIRGKLRSSIDTPDNNFNRPHTHILSQYRNRRL